MATVHGICAVCGRRAELTFEHVPPRKALNDRRVEKITGEDWLYGGPKGAKKSRIQQKGSGFQATCARCNNDTGGWYGREFLNWVFRAAEILQCYAGPAVMDADAMPHYVTATFAGMRPLLFLKQIVYMLIVINGPRFGDHNQHLRRFVLDREVVGLPPDEHFHLALVWGPHARHIGLGGKVDLEAGGAAGLSEIAFAPFSYVLRVGQHLESLPPCEISSFASYRPEDIVDVELHLLMGFVHLPLPCDYRSSAAIEAQGGDLGGPYLF
jgi:hypothetical protein